MTTDAPASSPAPAEVSQTAATPPTPETKSASPVDSSEPREGESLQDFIARTDPKKGGDDSAVDSPEPAAKEEPKSTVLKLKVNGREVEFDTSDQERLRSELQKGFSAQEKFQKAAQVQKQAEQFIAALKSNPEAVLSHPSLGLNVREWAETYLYGQIQQERMTPEEKSRHAEVEELNKYRRQEEDSRREADRAKQEQDNQRLEEARSTTRQQLEKQFTEALQTSGVPKNDWALRRMAELMKVAISKGHKHVTPQEVAPMVREQWITAQRELLSSLPPEELVKTLGKDTVDKIRQEEMRRARERSPYQQPSNTTSNRVEDDRPKSRISSPYDFVRGLK